MNDLISRQAAIEAVGYYCCHSGNKLLFADNALRQLPSAQPERKTGRWVLWNEPGSENAKCSECGEQYGQQELYIGGCEYPKYCPNCGARMEP